MRWPDVPDSLIMQAQQIVDVGRTLFGRGYVHGTTGNISQRVESDDFSGYVITPTDASLGCLTARRLAVLDTSGEQLFGDTASKTIELHRAIYAADEQANAVIHTHSHHLVLLTLLGVWKANSILPPITPYQVMKVGPVPLMGYAVPGHPSVAQAISQRLVTAKEHGVTLRAVMCDRLGPQVWHKDLAAAMAVLEELEQTARLWIEAGRTVQPMTRSQLDALAQRFGCVWAD